MMAWKPTSARRTFAAPRQGSSVRQSQAVDPSAHSFDRWLDEQLAALYRDILVEPLPDDLVQIVARLERGPMKADD